MAVLDLIVSLLVRWLMPAAPLLCRAYVRGYWLDGLWKGAAIGGAMAFVCLVLARLLLRLVRKRDRR